MKRTGIVLAVLLGLGGCGKKAEKTGEKAAPAGDGADLAERLKDAEARLAKLEEQMETVRGVLGPAMRPKPKPGVVYSVPIDGDPYKGAADAKVTVVEAFEFA